MSNMVYIVCFPDRYRVEYWIMSAAIDTTVYCHTLNPLYSKIVFLIDASFLTLVLLRRLILCVLSSLLYSSCLLYVFVCLYVMWVIDMIFIKATYLLTYLLSVSWDDHPPPCCPLHLNSCSSSCFTALLPPINHSSQVAQLLLTNPCEALHHGKRQSFKSHVTITMPLLWVICHAVARTDIV